jgi:hypothetical protein
MRARNAPPADQINQSNEKQRGVIAVSVRAEKWRRQPRVCGLRPTMRRNEDCGRARMARYRVFTAKTIVTRLVVISPV